MRVMVETEQPTSAASAVAVLPGRFRKLASVMEGVLRNTQFSVKVHLAHYAMVAPARACKLLRMRVRLKEFRDRLGLTLEQMAERTDISVSQLSRWEAHTNNIPSRRLPDLARHYECRVSEIFAEDNECERVELTPDQLTEMVRLAQDEMIAGTSFADWPRAVASNLHEQLRQIQAAGGLRVSSAAARPAGRAARSQGANIQAEREA